MKQSIEYVDTGPCKLHRNIAVKRWNLLCRIYQYHNKYTLVELTPKGKPKFKVQIYENDALFLIEKLNLVMFKDSTFKNGCKYMTI